MKKLFLLVSLMIVFVFGIFFGKNFFNKNYEKYYLLYAKDMKDWPRAFVDEGVEYVEMKPLDLPPIPKDNPLTKEKALLGEILFNERLLSKSQQYACISCHNKELGFGDGIKTSYGHDLQKGNRNAPNIMMSGFYKKLFWDGRADSLEDQALGPIQNPIEMANDLNIALQRLKNIPFYQNLFLLVFSDKSKIKLEQKSLLGKDFITQKDLDTLKTPIKDKKNKKIAEALITKQNLLKAIATYERTLVPKNTRFNQFLQGKYNALTPQEVYGLHVFRTKGRCMNCHNGMILSDSKFHNIGLSFYGRKLQDLGRYEISKQIEDVGAFKTPSLIGISKSAPYMHNGIFPHLRGVLNMYNAGFPTPKPTDSQRQDPLFPKTSPLIHKLNLSEDEINALEAFLKTL